MGYFFAFLSSLFFTLYAIPKKFAKLKPAYYVFFMGLNCLFISSFFYVIFSNDEDLFNKYLFLSFMGGIIWFCASFLFFYCIDRIGVARATQFKSLQGPIGSILILTILSEFNNLNIYLLILAIIFILLASLMLVVKDENNHKIKIKYIFLALLSALLYGINGFIRKYVTFKGFIYSQQIYSAIGILFGSLIYIILKNKKLNIKKENIKNFSLALLSGFFYYFASFFMLIAYKHIEGSIAFSIVQLNALWASIIGIFIFKEIDYKKHSKKLILGLLFALIGIYLLMIC